MKKLLGVLSVFLVLFVVVVYARDCRVSFNQWKHCRGEAGQQGILGEYVNFGWNFAGLFSKVLYVDGRPAARIVSYDFGLSGDVMEIATLDGSSKSRYCGK
jgi:hypothetical protein